MTKTKITPAGLKSLTFVADRGGEVNSFAGQRGFNVGATWDKLLRDGFLARIPDCEACATRHDEHGRPCKRPLAGQRGGDCCYLRVRITDAGRAALA